MAIPINTVGKPGRGFGSRGGDFNYIEASPWYERMTVRVKISGERSKVISPTRTITETYDYDKSKTFNRVPIPTPEPYDPDDGVVETPTLWGNSNIREPDLLGSPNYNLGNNEFVMILAGNRSATNTFYEPPDPNRSLFTTWPSLLVGTFEEKLGEKDDDGDVTDITGGAGISPIFPRNSADSQTQPEFEKRFLPDQLEMEVETVGGFTANFALPSGDAALRDLRGRLFTQTRAAPQGTYWDSSSVQTRVDLTFL